MERPWVFRRSKVMTEYLVTLIHGSAADRTIFLNERAAEGWAVLSIDAGMVYFHRVVFRSTPQDEPVHRNEPAVQIVPPVEEPVLPVAVKELQPLDEPEKAVEPRQPMTPQRPAIPERFRKPKR